MADVSSLTHPRNSHRKAVILPKASNELAEFFGIMMGDGGINNPWQVNISLNSVADAEYAEYVCGLVEKLFGIAPAMYKNKYRKAVRVVVASVSIVDFLVSKGLLRGDKIRGGLAIPEWILGKASYRKACVRGLMDTDGCLYIHRHTVGGKRYENLGLCFCSHSPALLEQVGIIFEEFGVIPHSSKRGRNIYLYRVDAIERYLKLFGTSNERIQSVYRDWKRGRVVEGARLESV